MQLNKHNKKVLLIIISFLLIFNFPFQAYSKELEINFHRQNTRVWCWAATIAMIVEYVTGEPMEDCKVLNRYDQNLGGLGNCCLGDLKCVRAGNIQQMGHILGNLFNINGRYITGPPTLFELKGSIDSNRPLIAHLRNLRGSGHVVVVSGYKNFNKVIVLDPINGRHVVNYNELISSFTYGFWTGSILITSQPHGGNNLNF